MSDHHNSVFMKTQLISSLAVRQCKEKVRECIEIKRVLERVSDGTESEAQSEGGGINPKNLSIFTNCRGRSEAI